jgi:predicted component of type VI protein secretion system
MIPVVVRYTSRPGHEADLEQMCRRHWNTLHREHLTTDRPAILLRVDGAPGVFLELFEWVSTEAIRSAHGHPAVRELWDAMESVGTVEPWDGAYLDLE